VASEEVVEEESICILGVLLVVPEEVLDILESDCVVEDAPLFLIVVEVDLFLSGEEREEYRLRPGDGGILRPERAAYKGHTI